jgi:hypothetical protein
MKVVDRGLDVHDGAGQARGLDQDDLKRRLNSGSAPRSRRTIFTATALPLGDKPQKTSPMPPAPSLPWSR